MAAILIGNWWALAIRGIAAIVFGVIAVVAPRLTATALVLVFGAYLLVDGIFAFVAAQRAAYRHGRSWPLIIEGLLDIALALIAFLFPDVALVALVYLIAIWALLSGIALVSAGLALLRLSGHLLVIFGGVLSIVLGIVLLLHPDAGIVALAWWLGVYALIFGVVLFSAAFRLRHRRYF